MGVLLLIFGMFLAIPIVVLVVAIPISIRKERDRKAALWNWAAAHGWTFLESSRAPWTDRLPHGRSSRLGVTMSGPYGGRWVTVAEYSYQTTTTSGDSTTTHTHDFLVVVVHLEAGYPPVAVQPRGLVSQLGRAVFGDKPTATGNVLFDSQFRITAPDPAYAKAMVLPPLIDAHIARAVPCWSLAGAELLTCTPLSRKLRDPSVIPGYIAPVVRVAELLGG